MMRNTNPVFKATEIILRADGSVYHLGLFPNELASKVILVGDPERVPIVARQLDSIRVHKQNREFCCITGSKEGQEISILSTGIGTDNIDIVLTEIDLLVNFNLAERQAYPERKTIQLLRLGTCGTLREEVAPGSFAFTTTAIGMDALGNSYLWEPLGREPIIEQDFIKQYPKVCLRSLPYIISNPDIDTPADWIRGITFTCPGFYAAQGRNIFGKSRFPNLLEELIPFHSGEERSLNFEMETAGILLMSRLLNHKAYSLSLVMANRVSGAFYDDYEAGMSRMITAGISWLLKLN